MPTPPPPPFTLTAWIDESVIVGDEHRPGTYTLASVIVDSSAAAHLRDALRALTEPKIVRLHWKAESAKRRDLIAQTIAGLDIAVIIAAGSPVHRQKQERARRCCLECVLYELDQVGVTQVWLESRAPSQDRRDRRLIDSARDKGLVSHGLLLDFARPLQEPMLWLPDAVAGAVTSANMGEPRWLLALSEVTEIHHIAVR